MISVTASILVNDGKVLIAKRSASDKLPSMWEFPGGKIEPNETPEQCLERELEEEFCISTSIEEYLGFTTYDYGHIHIKLLFYRTKWTGGDINPQVHDEIAFVSIEEMKKYDFAPADVPFVKKLRSGQIEL